MKCPICGTKYENEEFCLGDGTALVPDDGGQTNVQGTRGGTAAIAEPAKVAARTLQFATQTIPLYEGQRFTLGRPDGANNPDLPIDDDSVSATLLVLTVTNGQLVAGYEGADAKPYDVQKNLKPGEKMDVNPGEVIWAGNNPIVVI